MSFTILAVRIKNMTNKPLANILFHAELVDAIKKSTSDKEIRTASELLLSAVTDWPTQNLKDPIDLIAELKNEISDKLTYKNIESYLTRLNPESDSLKIEAIQSLLEMFCLGKKNNNNSIELETVIEILTMHCRQK